MSIRVSASSWLSGWLVDCHLVKDVTVNVAYWNLGPRRLTASGGGYLVNGEPLTFFHFSGYDPRRPWLLSRHGGPRRGPC